MSHRVPTMTAMHPSPPPGVPARPPGHPTATVPLYGLDIETDTTVDGLDPSHGGVVAVGLATPEGDEVFLGDEADILTRLDRRLAELAPGVLVTWNGGSFDLPFLAARARRPAPSWASALAPQRRHRGRWRRGRRRAVAAATGRVRGPVGRARPPRRLPHLPGRRPPLARLVVRAQGDGPARGDGAGRGRLRPAAPPERRRHRRLRRERCPAGLHAWCNGASPPCSPRWTVRPPGDRRPTGATPTGARAPVGDRSLGAPGLTHSPDAAPRPTPRAPRVGSAPLGSPHRLPPEDPWRPVHIPVPTRWTRRRSPSCSPGLLDADERRRAAGDRRSSRAATRSTCTSRRCPTTTAPAPPGCSACAPRGSWCAVAAMFAGPGTSPGRPRRVVGRGDRRCVVVDRAGGIASMLQRRRPAGRRARRTTDPRHVVGPDRRRAAPDARSALARRRTASAADGPGRVEPAR